MALAVSGVSLHADSQSRQAGAMRRLLRTEWIEWLESLSMEGAVELEGVPGAKRGPFLLRECDYSPFDDVVELVLDGDAVHPLRVLIDDPRAISYDGASGEIRKIVIETATGRVTLVQTRATPPHHRMGASAREG